MFEIELDFYHSVITTLIFMNFLFIQSEEKLLLVHIFKMYRIDIAVKS